jgi:uncharacterized membrane-anchored protein
VSAAAVTVRDWLTSPTALRVPRITAAFWIIKLLSTAMGESTSDYLVHVMVPELAVLLGFAGFAVALYLQFRVAPYIAWTYWLAVVMVGTFGTMAADVLHVGLGVPYQASALLYAIALAAVFAAWWRTEKTLSFHSVDTPRRELFYWAAVVATFAMGTALGDFTAYSLHLGYFPSALVFAALMIVPIGATACCDGMPCSPSGSPTSSPGPSGPPSRTGWESRAASAGWGSATAGWRSASPS